MVAKTRKAAEFSGLSCVFLQAFVYGASSLEAAAFLGFMPRGIADEDLAVGKFVLDQAKRKKIKLRKVAEI